MANRVTEIIVPSLKVVEFLQRYDVYNKNQISIGVNGNTFTTAAQLSVLIKEQAALTKEKRALRKKNVSDYTKKYGNPEFVSAVLNVYECAQIRFAWNKGGNNNE